jgi:Tol biopolymer transport system component
MRISPAIAATLVASAAWAQGASIDLRGALPPEQGVVNQVVSVQPGTRTYFIHRSGDLVVYDHASRASTRLAERVWDASVSAKRDFVVYVKDGEARADHFIYVLSLDRERGTAKGPERRVSSTIGDAPAISPDGKLIAFARDDTTGVGQSLVVAPLGAGKERVVASAMPSSIRGIMWTPDGKTIFFGVNLPVPCVPEWSCLPLGEDQRVYGSIRRVAATGGAVTVVVPRALGVFPGLSPDGTAIVYNAVGGVRRWIVANGDGTERSSLSLSSSQTIQGWMSGATLIVGDGGFGRAVRAISGVDLSSGRGPR